MYKHQNAFLRLFWGLCGFVTLLPGASVILLPPSQASPQPVGVALQWSVGSTDLTGPVEYSWSVTTPNGLTSNVSDYDPASTFTYMPLEDGSYTVTVSAKNLSSPVAQGTASLTYVANSLLTGSAPVITATSNPFVVVYSAPCVSGTLRVSFWAVGSTNKTTTAGKVCYAGHSANILVAGMIASTPYTFQHQISNGFSLQIGPLLSFTTNPLPAFDFRRRAVTGSSTALEQTILFSFIAVSGIQTTVAYDLAGNPIWYYPPAPGQFPLLLRPVKGGTMLIFPTTTTFREIDLLGNAVHQTSIARLTEQIAFSGVPYPKINDFNHEALRLPNNYTAVVVGLEQIVPDASGNPVDLQGTGIIVLDQNWQVVWTWNPYVKFDTTRMPVSSTYACPGFGCEPVTLAPSAIDWMHGNALWSADDGNLLLSMRSQDWVIKIDYRNGIGTGNILWRLGNGGDFTLTNPQIDPYPWFSGQHSVNFNGNYLTLFDNGNMRVNPTAASTANSNLCCSRVQAYLIAESTNTATLATNGPFQSYSFAVGSAQKMLNGNLHASSGFQTGGSYPWIAEAEEFSTSGASLFSFHVDNTAYRSFRMRDLYTPQN